jgi:hypothetical protein
MEGPAELWRIQSQAVTPVALLRDADLQLRCGSEADLNSYKRLLRRGAGTRKSGAHTNNPRLVPFQRGR